MTARMFKYPIAIADIVTVQMAPDSIVRHVGMQGATLCLWAETDESAVPQMRQFRVVGTGHFVPADSRYLGTGFDGPFVWHVYEVTS